MSEEGGNTGLGERERETLSERAREHGPGEASKQASEGKAFGINIHG